VFVRAAVKLEEGQQRIRAETTTETPEATGHSHRMSRTTTTSTHTTKHNHYYLMINGTPS